MQPQPIYSSGLPESFYKELEIAALRLKIRDYYHKIQQGETIYQEIRRKKRKLIDQVEELNNLIRSYGFEIPNHKKESKMFKKPILKNSRYLPAYIERQYTISHVQSAKLTSEQNTELVPVTVEIIGSSETEFYFVAKDICMILGNRPSQMREVFKDFTNKEKFLLKLPSKNRSKSTQYRKINVLTMEGFQRLIKESKAEHKNEVLNWIQKWLEKFGM